MLLRYEIGTQEKLIYHSFRFFFPISVHSPTPHPTDRVKKESGGSINYGNQQKSQGNSPKWLWTNWNTNNAKATWQPKII